MDIPDYLEFEDNEFEEDKMETVSFTEGALKGKITLTEAKEIVQLQAKNKELLHKIAELEKEILEMKAKIMEIESYKMSINDEHFGDF